MNCEVQHQHNSRKTVSLSRSVVLTKDTCIPSLLILGKLLCASDDAAIDMGTLRARLVEDWAPSGTVNFWRVTGGAFLVQFHDEADLRRVMDGAPWCCDGGRLFLMQHAKPEMNLPDQLDGPGFTTADLWVQFHFSHVVPVEYFSADNLCALAARIGVPVVLPDVGTASSSSSPQVLRARVRVDVTGPLVLSFPVELDDGRCEMVSVVYERIPSLCRSCGVIIGHLADQHCPRGNLPGSAAHRSIVSSRSHRDNKQAGCVWSHLGSRKSPSRETQPQQLPRKEQEEDGSGPAEHLLEQETPGRQLASKANRCLPCNILKLISRTKKELVAREEVHNTGGRVTSSLQDMQSSQKHRTLLLTFSTHQRSVQESLGMEQEGTHANSSLAPRTLSGFQLAGGYVNYYSYPRSRKNPRIEVMVETQCSSHLMNKAMEWLAENTGLKASYDGNRGGINIVGLQLDQRMGPLDLVAYIYPEGRPRTGVSESQEKPNSPTRFEDMIVRLHDENCCSKDTSSSRNTTRFGLG